jgi:hypothetical protein
MGNFIAHKPSGGGSRTDADVIGVRLPHSEESPFQDDESRLQIQKGKIDVVLAEAKRGLCDLNPSWTGNSPQQPLEYVLRRVGLFQSHVAVDAAASDLYQRCIHDPDSGVVIRVVCFGSRTNDALKALQILWPDVISFIAKRFKTYEDEKADNDHWDSFGKYLWEQRNKAPLPSIDCLIDGWERKCRCWPREARPSLQPGN